VTYINKHQAKFIRDPRHGDVDHPINPLETRKPIGISVLVFYKIPLAVILLEDGSYLSYVKRLNYQISGTAFGSIGILIDQGYRLG